MKINLVLDMAACHRFFCEAVACNQLALLCSEKKFCLVMPQGIS
jgi:hypothetical protein